MYVAEPPTAIEWEVPFGGEPLFFGRVYGDVSCRHPVHRGLSRAGWAVIQLVSMHEESGIRIAVRGCLPHRVQEIKAQSCMLYCSGFVICRLRILS